MSTTYTVALAGNPNSGKTTLFNAITGARQHVGNYPGVTVERKEGTRQHKDARLEITDLPGTYSLTAYTAEELITRNSILNDKPDVVVDVIDTTNLERNLYLAVQLMELHIPLVLAFNMNDMAHARGLEFDLDLLSRFFHARIVPTVGHKGQGITELLDAVVETAQETTRECLTEPVIHYGREVENELNMLESLIRQYAFQNGKYDPHWLALKLLENDRVLAATIEVPAIHEQVRKSTEKIQHQLGENAETAIAAARYGFISGACQEAVRSTLEIRHTLSDRIDAVVTNRILGLPLFLGLMYLVFQLTFTLGDPFMGWIETFFGWLSGIIEGFWPEGSESLLKSLLLDGIIGGVGGVVVFLPNILLLFLAIAILEDSGYMARVAFIMDRLMHKIGLHGKSFIPLLIGFGCSVPAIMATRTLENRRDRLTTMMVAPLMSCGARLPIYALIIPAFFPETWYAPMLWTIYVIGVLLAILSAKLLRVTLLKGESVPFVMELPPYRMPTLRGVFMHMGERGWLYLKKAGTIILGISILLWAMTTFPQTEPDPNLNEEEQQAEQLTHTIAGRIGHALEPVLKPMGFDWQIGTALIGAFAAKEVFVAQMGIVYSVGEADEESEPLREKLAAVYNPLIGFCIMLFCLISAPCMATIAVTKRESNSWKWALFQLGGLTALAWIITTLVYQIGRLAGFGV